jgi:hypothetical protein
MMLSAARWSAAMGVVWRMENPANGVGCLLLLRSEV